MEVNLKSNGWYNKLQDWTLGNMKPNLFSLCPYFWLTIFCIIISPLTLIYKTIKYIVIKFDQNIIQKYFDNFADSLSAKEAFILKHNWSYSETRTPLFKNRVSPRDMYNRWYDGMIAKGKSEDEIQKIIEDAKIEYYKYNEELEKLYDQKQYEERQNKLKIQARKEKMKTWWVPVVLWTRRLTTVMITLILMIFLTFTINFFVANWDTNNILFGLRYIIMALLFIGSIIGVSYIGYLIINWCIENNKFKPITKFLSWIFRPVGQFFSYIYRGIKNGLYIFFEYFKANKNDYCPAINWDVKDNIDIENK